MATDAPRTNPFLAKTTGKADTGSRKKADNAALRADQEIARVQEKPLSNGNGHGVPVNANGTPLMQAEMSAAELVPTGQYANVSVGPARLHFWIDPDRELADGESYFSERQRATIAQALNEAAELVEADVIAIQRNLVMESLQQQVGDT
jgi:hypothetical protein